MRPASLPRLVALALGCALAGSAAAGDVVINELVVNPKGGDSGYEWLELYNTTGSTVDLSGWAIEAGTSSYSTKHTFAEGTTLAAGGFLTLAEGEVAFTADVTVDGTLAMGNASDVDAVRLVDAEGQPVDTVLYGSNNKNEWTDDTGSLATAFAPKPGEGANDGEGEALARKPDGADTNDSSVDFVKVPHAGITPGSTNEVEIPEDCPGPYEVVINEFMPNPEGSEGNGLEWIELYNAGSAEVDLEDWRVNRWQNGEPGAYGTGVVTLPEGTSLAAGAHLLIGEENIATADVTASGNLGMTGSGAIQLQDCDGDRVDTVLYGADSEDGVTDDSGNVGTSNAPVPGDGESLARWRDGVDTDQASADFVLSFGEDITPGTSNPEREPIPCDAGDPGIVVNEFLPDPDGADGDALLEYVEIYNATDRAIQLAGWAVVKASRADSWSSAFEFPTDASLELAPGAFLLVGDANVEGRDAGPLGDGTLGLYSGSGGDGVGLRNCEGSLVDIALYGDTNDDGLAEDDGETPALVGPDPGSDEAVQRLSDGVDSDRSAIDFVLAPEPTPGATNIEVEPVVCQPVDDAVNSIKINEFLPNPEGTDTEALTEFVELMNPTDAPVALDGWTLTFATKLDDYEDVDVELPGGIDLGAGGYFLFGALEVEGADYVFSSTAPIPGGTDGDAVILKDCEGTLVDIVVYGDTTQDGLTGEDGELAPPVTAVESGESIARRENGVDTESPDDWFTDRTPTPGEPNDPQTGGGGSDDLDGPSGCGGNPGLDNPGTGSETGCSTVPVPLFGLGLFAGFVALLRRRP